MKNFIISALVGLLFTSTVSLADEHYKEIEKIVDKFTGKVVYGGPNIFAGNLMTMMSRYENQRYYLTIKDENQANCTDENSTINFFVHGWNKINR